MERPQVTVVASVDGAVGGGLSEDGQWRWGWKSDVPRPRSDLGHDPEPAHRLGWLAIVHRMSIHTAMNQTSVIAMT